MNNRKLSIIIPCYNCTSTLEEALASVYAQNLTIPFEVVMVDDGSTDKTHELIVELSKKYRHIIYYAHEKNRGGGATRNTGILKSTGDLIYCLDSDNFFAPNTLQKMVDYLDKKKCDAVAFSERRFFIDKNKGKYNAQFYKISDRPVSIEDIFDENILLDNFLYTRKSFYETSGYPENHGFDTQCFELRYLSSGHKLYFCPNTSCYHRQISKSKSYFERVYETGEFSKNMYLIYEDMFFLFSPAVREKIIKFDIFKNSSMGAGLESVVKKLFLENKKNFFIKNHHLYIHQNGFDAYVNDHKNSDEVTDIFCFGVYYYRQGKYNDAMECYRKLAICGIDTKIIYYDILRVITAMAHPNKKVEVEKMTSALINSLRVKKPDDLRAGIFRRIKRKVGSIFK